MDIIIIVRFLTEIQTPGELVDMRRDIRGIVESLYWLLGGDDAEAARANREENIRA